MQDKKKKTKKQIKIHDLKPSKDAKGGVATNVSTGHNVNTYGTRQSVQRPGNPNS